jgi:hypothetical protein
MIHDHMHKLLDTRRVLVAIVALGVFALAARGLTDPDVWWHLRTGQLILRNHAVFHTDPFSFTRLGQTWVNHEWLSDIFIFWVYHAAGWGGLIVAFAAITTAIFLLLFLRCPGRLYVGAIATVWAAVASMPLWGVRPQTFSLLLFSLFLVILDKSEERPNLLWWIPSLQLVWVNLHAGYASGIALLVLVLAGQALDAALGFEVWTRTVPRIKKLSLVLVVSLALVPLNPYGVKMYWYPLATLRSSAMQSHIAEWFSPDFHQAQYWPALCMILAGLVAIAWSPQRMKPRDLLLLLTTMYMGLRSVRHLALYLVVAAPLLSELADGWLEARQLRPHRSHSQSPNLGQPLFNAALLVAFAVYTGARVQSVVRSQASTEAAEFPSAAATFLATSHPTGPIFNDYNWGGYLIWRLYPEYRVYIDGRADLYGDSFMESFAATSRLTDHWETPLQLWCVRTVIVPPASALAAALLTRSDWKLIYSDSQAVVLTQTRPPSR